MSEVLAYPLPLIVVIGYLCGSVPTAYWLGLYVYRLNIFEHGSRNMGATNVHRVLGPGPFLVTLAVDIGKGVLAVLAAGHFVQFPDRLFLFKLVAGLSAILGHTLSFWVRFRGGKGVATGLGVFLALAPVSSLCALFVFLGMLAIFRYVSLGSITASAALPAFILFWGEGGPEWQRPLAGLAAGVAAFIIFKHKANIQRLIVGREAKLGAVAHGTARDGTKCA